MTTTKVQEKIQEFLNGLSTDHTELSDYVSPEDITDYSTAFDEIETILQNNNSLDVEIIYYSRALEYLKDNDPSLNESLSIASEYGFTPENLNSEVLASLLASQENREQFQELENEIETFFNDLEEEIDTYKNDTVNLLIEAGEEAESVEDLELDELTELAEEKGII
jgi:hypothetical protein